MVDTDMKFCKPCGVKFAERTDSEIEEEEAEYAAEMAEVYGDDLEGLYGNSDDDARLAAEIEREVGGDAREIARGSKRFREEQVEEHARALSRR